MSTLEHMQWILSIIGTNNHQHVSGSWGGSKCRIFWPGAGGGQRREGILENVGVRE